jgi:glycosyltransferase involved in cell wall biosynthesis
MSLSGGDRGRILLATHSYPPRPVSASSRPWGLAKYMRRLGYRVTVLSSDAWGTDAAEPEHNRDVIRCRDLLGTRLNWRRENMRAYEGATQASYAKASRLAGLVVPDIALATWIPFALPVALRIARTERVDCVITTSGPESTHLIGLALRRVGIPWVADLRDGWRFEPYRGWPGAARERLDGWLEHFLLRRASRATTVSEPITEDLHRRLGLQATTVPNGFDPEELESEQPDAAGALDENRHSLVHTGRFASGGRSPEALIAALRLLARRSPDELASFELILAGPLSEDESTGLGDPQLAGVVRHLGVLERSDALHLQASADSLLVLTAGTRSGETTGKLFEYLHAGRPILVLGEGTEAARIARRTRAGIVVPADDPERIAGALLSLARGELAGYDPGTVQRVRADYAYPRMAERMAAVVEAARSDPPR